MDHARKVVGPLLLAVCTAVVVLKYAGLTSMGEPRKPVAPLLRFGRFTAKWDEHLMGKSGSSFLRVADHTNPIPLFGIL